MAHFWCVLALLCFALCTAANTETEELQQDSMPWLEKLEDKPEMMENPNLIQLLYKLSKFDNGILLQGPEVREKEETKRRGLQRGMTTRKTACRVFFWKSWTFC